MAGKSGKDWSGSGMSWDKKSGNGLGEKNYSVR